MNCFDTLRKEHANIEHLLGTIPFNDSCSVDSKHFLNIYQLTHDDMLKLNENDVKFPMDSNKLLKLGISLGNLIKSLQHDEEIYTQQKQQQQQKLFMNSLDPKARKINAKPSNNEPYNPFKEQSLSDSPVYMNETSQPIYQIKFIRNLLSILKNFDIGNYSVSQKLQEVSSSNSTLNQYDVSTSPVKLNSNQLLIEKLEININLDTLFIYKIILQLFLKIYANIERHLLHLGETSSNNEEIPSNLLIANPPVPSANHNNPGTSVGEYHKLLKQAVNKISNGLIDPFTRLIINRIVLPSINGQVNSFLNSLA
mmetsp:Transcript_5043/g.5602  ORF Transcript_5043/g.5602 Transcript_5043/m.5602 type:complete len:311 (-) Transcript_5043:5946-6878(-)